MSLIAIRRYTDGGRLLVQVSIITPCYNDAATIEETIASVAAQSFADWEHWIVDDASTDESPALIEQAAARDSRIKPIFRSSNQGAAAARNLGIQASQGRYIAFLDADDLWSPDKLTQQIAFMLAEDIALSFTSYRRVRMGGEDQGVVPAPERLDRNALLTRNQIGCLTAIYDTQYFGRVEMPEIRREDWVFWLMLLERVPYAYGLDEVLATHRRRAGSLSANRLKVARLTWRMYRDVLNLPRLRAAWYFACYGARHLADWLRRP